MLDTLDLQIRKKIKEYILEIDSNAKIYPYNALTHDVASWANLFKSSPKKHGWIIVRKGFGSEWNRGYQSKDTYKYDVWGFYGFYQFCENDNSDNEFSAILDQLQTKLKAKPQLDLSNIKEHKLLQLPDGGIDATIRSGNEQLHFAPCTLEVELCC